MLFRSSAATAAQSAGTDYLGSTALGDATKVGFGLSTTPAATGVSAATEGLVGSNAASGLGYLGGAESLPAGTAGITGVTVPSSLAASDLYKAYNALTNAGKKAVSSAYPQTGIAEAYHQANPFYTPKEQPILAETKTTKPVYLGALADLLRG